MGREGEGPGEFRGPLGVAVSDGGEVAVHDGSRGAVIRYGLDRSILPQPAYPFSVITNRLRHFEIVPGGTVMWARDRFAGSDDRFDRLLLLSADDTVALVAGTPRPTSTAQYPACGMTFTMSVPLSPSIRWAQWGQRIAVALWGEDRVDLFDGLRLTRSLRLAPAGPELSEGDAVRILEEYGTRGPCNATPSELARKHGFYPRLQSILGLALAPDGTIWVGWRRDGDRRALFDSTGAPVGLLAPGFPMPLN